MSSVVSLKSLLLSPQPSPAPTAKKNAAATAAPGTIRPQEIVLRPTPLRRYFE